jgi:signal transduction histidine kinase/ActR/RegA family two-component response regulator
VRGAEEFPVELTIWPIGRAPDVTFHAFVRDISERKAAEHVVEAARDEAERANRAKSDFLSRMSHELRTPMNAVLGFAQLLEMEPQTSEQKEDTTEILKAGRHLLELIDEVLDISRIEAGRLRLSLEPVDVVEAVEECVSLLTPLANQEGVRVNLARDDSIPERAASVVADRQRLKQVILNLVANAIKYNREDGSVRISFEPAEPSRLKIHVTDTGHGIPAGRMEKLFAPFERLGAEVSGVEGTGLGLALSRALVEAMGGTISVRSEVGIGSTFSVELTSTENVSTSVEREAAHERGVVTASKNSTTHTVLYIEDNLSNLKLVERLVAQRPNIALVSAMQGGIGLTLARDHRPDLILLDLNLPDMAGEEVLARLQSDPRTAVLPVVVISADATSGQIKRLLEIGARAYLTKPLDVSRFFEIIDGFCADATSGARRPERPV